MTARKSSTGFNRHRAAKVLAEATLTSDTAAARTHGVSTSSIATWRKRLDTDPELAALYAEQLARADGAWRDRLREVLAEGARAQLTGLQKLNELIAGADNLVDVLDALRGAQEATRVAGELLITYESLVIPDDPPHDRQGASDPAHEGRGREGTAPTTH